MDCLYCENVVCVELESSVEWDDDLDVSIRELVFECPKCKKVFGQRELV